MNAAPHYIVALKSLDKGEIIQGRVEKQVRREIEIQQNLRYVSVSWLASRGPNMRSSCAHQRRAGKRRESAKYKV